MDASGKPVSYAQCYFGTYATKYNQEYNGNNADAAVLMARDFANANASLPKPDSKEFNDVRNQIIYNPTPGQGARLVLRFNLNEGSGQYTFKNDFADVTVSAAYRQFLLGSDGSLFEDTKDGDRIKNYEYGAYAQASKTLLDDHLKLMAASWVDRFQNFGTVFSLRASVVYSLGADNLQNFRASLSRAFRAPTQNDQYIKLDVSRTFLLGNVRGGFQGYTLALATQLPGILVLLLSGNYRYNNFITQDFRAGTQSFFNTPRHKFNLDLDGQALDRALSYNLNYRWVDSFLYGSTFATGIVPTAQIVGAQVDYTIKRLHTYGSGGRHQLVRRSQLPSVRRGALRSHRLLRAAVRHQVSGQY